MFLASLASIFFIAAAAMGIQPLWMLIKRRPGRMKFILIHGGLALTGLTLLIIGTVDAEGDMPYLSLFGFVMTAMGGLMLFALRRSKAPLPAGLAMLHPVFGIGSLILLFMFLFGWN